MVDAVISGASPASIPAAKPPLASNGRPQQFYADGSAVPDVIAYHHRPEDLGIEGIISLPEANPEDSSFFGEDGLTFGDFLDIINPLQHIPIVSTIYRALTGDEIAPGARIAGGALFGGPIGAGIAIVNAAVEASTGEDIGETVLAALTGSGTADESVAVAAAGAVTPAGATVSALTAANPGPALPASPLPPDTTLALALARTAPAAHNAGRPETAPPQAAAITPAASRKPFGGMGALPFTQLQNQTEDPVGAILQARAAVPAAGPIAGLGGMVQTPLGRQAPVPNISSRLADKLTALSAQTAPPDRIDKKPDEKEDNPFENRETSVATQDRQIVPPALIPQNMLETLDRYRQMKQAEVSPG
ncbi:MAG: hypothetical protein WD767_20765 [Alphaproteobacteria bacterium]